MRWVFPGLTLALWACNSHDLQAPRPNPQQQTDFEILVSPQREVDILFVIDNSLSMDPKQEALAENFPKMIEALEQVKDGLPDVRIGVVSSDIGAGYGAAGDNCKVSLGNQAILWGNDPNFDPKNENNRFATVKGRPNAAGADGCGMNPGARWIEDIRNPDGVARDRNYQGKLTDVFSCLATAVGVNGCGFEHHLQALRVAINPQEGINMAQNGKFLRRDAYLAVVLIADEDDCSAEPDRRKNGGIFSEWPGGNAASLRCAALGHVCNGKDIPKFTLSDGYTGDGPFETNFSDCDAKDIERQPPKDPNDIDPTYDKLPLIRIREMIDSVNQVKARPTEQILVSGVIGWPQEEDLNKVKYRIDKDLTAFPETQRTLWDYMPICSIPERTSPVDNNIYKAYGSFRLKKFIDAFKTKDDKSVFSLCDPSNFRDAMGKIGDAIASRLTPGCVNYPLIDTDPNVNEVQPQCQVKYRFACDSPGKGDCHLSGYREEALPECIDPETHNPLDPRNPDKSKIPQEARPCWFLEYDSNPTTGCPRAFKQQRISALRKNDGLAPAGTLLGMQCLTCVTPPIGDESSCPPLGTF